MRELGAGLLWQEEGYFGGGFVKTIEKPNVMLIRTDFKKVSPSDEITDDFSLLINFFLLKELNGGFSNVIILQAAKWKRCTRWNYKKTSQKIKVKKA